MRGSINLPTRVEAKNKARSTVAVGGSGEEPKARKTVSAIAKRKTVAGPIGKKINPDESSGTYSDNSNSNNFEESYASSRTNSKLSVLKVLGPEQFSEYLHLAILSEDEILLQRILAQDNYELSWLNNADQTGMTPLRKAARIGNAQICSQLIEAGADFRLNDYIVMFVAISWGNLNVLSILLECEADPNCVHSRNGETPLTHATRGEDLTMVQTLVEHGADVNYGQGENIPLKIAWKDQKLEMVRFLVAHQSAVREEEWFNAIYSPNLCYNLAEGLRQRIEMFGYNGLPCLSKNALLLWIEKAPKASATLFNDILIRRVTNNVPERAEMVTHLTATYVEGNVFEKDVAEFQKLTPRDRGSGVNVEISYICLQGMMDDFVFYGLSRSSDTSLLKSKGVEALLWSTWQHVEYLYNLDVVLECVLLVTLSLWATMLQVRYPMCGEVRCEYDASRESRYFLMGFIRSVSTIMIAYIAVREGISEILLMRFYSLKGHHPGTLAFYGDINYLNVLNCAAAIQLLYVVYFRDENLPIYPEPYLLAMSISAFLRWIRLMNFICAYDQFGPSLLPIIRSVGQIGIFTFVFFLVLFAFAHATFVFEVPKFLCEQQEIRECVKPTVTLYEHFFRQFFLGMTIRWPIFMNALRSDDIFYGTQLLWYSIAAVAIVLILLQIFVGVMAEAYVDQRQISKSSFIQTRASICFSYFRTKIAPKMPKKEYYPYTKKVRWTRRQILKFFLYYFAFVCKCLGGIIRRPVEEGYLWFCVRKEEKVVQAGTIFDIWQHCVEQHFARLLKKSEDGQDWLIALIERVTHIEDLLDTLYTCATDAPINIENPGRYHDQALDNINIKQFMKTVTNKEDPQLSARSSEKMDFETMR